MSTQKALFAAGCFWGVQYYFDQVPGVVKTTVGYTGGHTENPTYDDVITETTGHAETTLIEFDPSKVSYRTLVKQFFRMHDPTQMNRQGPDIGESYRSAIFYTSQEQRNEAIQERNKLQEDLNKPIATKIEPAGAFYEAEPYHQKFTERTGIGMCHIPYAPVPKE
ncbi:MAG TPA: peptide-methionine (S)-S-oxide reductase MsrA [Candidatus Saccharimonadales bacterium]|nr:peptide-methionine (S)-S-oxide reductase MsrA [Candidatus Saccharimonadales bacterium]